MLEDVLPGAGSACLGACWGWFWVSLGPHEGGFRLSFGVFAKCFRGSWGLFGVF